MSGNFTKIRQKIRNEGKKLYRIQNPTSELHQLFTSCDAPNVIFIDFNNLNHSFNQEDFMEIFRQIGTTHVHFFLNSTNKVVECFVHFVTNAEAVRALRICDECFKAGINMGFCQVQRLPFESITVL